MRSAIAYHLLSGHAWFSAGAIVVALIALDLSGRLRGRIWPQRLARVGFFLAIGIAILSGTPSPLLVSLPALAALIAYGVLGFVDRRHRALIPIGIVAALLAVVAVAIEIPWHLSPETTLAPGTKIVVIGDSLSSGGFGEIEAWPQRMSKATGLEVINLALPGETAASALMFQTPHLPAAARDALVLVEIGGNDLLGDTKLPRYEENLGELLARVDAAGPSQIVMFELPIPPGRWRWGAAQRGIAKDWEIDMIPKRVLARVVTDQDLVLDGLHPSSAGHEKLARAVARSLDAPVKP